MRLRKGIACNPDIFSGAVDAYGAWQVITLMLTDANWRAFTVIWKIKEGTLKLIFKLRPHRQLKVGEKPVPLDSVPIPLGDYFGGRLITVVSTQGHSAGEHAKMSFRAQRTPLGL